MVDESQKDIDFNTLVQSASPQEEFEKRERALDLKLKEKYATRWFWVLISQLIIVNAVVILVGFSILKLNPWTIRIFFTATLLEIFGILIVITKHLFPHK